MTKTGAELKTGDVLKLSTGETTIKRKLGSRSKFHHHADLYETTDRRILAIHATAEVEVEVV